MSERNVELTRRAVEAYNARDIEAMVAYFDPRIEFHGAFAAVGGAVYQGHDGMRRWHRDQEDAWGNEVRVEPEAYFDLGENTLAFYAMRAQGRHSGVETAMPIAAAMRWRDGLLVYWRVYADRKDALRELGVSENDLERIEP
jgi:ketosteroid isomerase-like protein